MPDRKLTPHLANGYTILPQGQLVNSVTWLNIHAPFPIRPARALPDLALERLDGTQAARYSTNYRVLALRWLWAGRLAMPVPELARLLDNPDIVAFALVHQGRDMGLLELDFRHKGEAELAYFGIFDEMIGQGAGSWLLQKAIAEVSARLVPCLFVHTCNFDHPAALSFYRAQGFEPYQTGYEIMDDPRLDGTLPRDAAPQIPLLG